MGPACGPTYDFDFRMGSNCGSEQALVLFRGPGDFRHCGEKRWERWFINEQRKVYEKSEEALGCAYQYWSVLKIQTGEFRLDLWKP